MMKTLKTFVTGLLLSAVCLLPIAVNAAELQPFFTLKLSSVNDLTAVAEKFAGMAGAADNDNFRQVVAIAKGIKGLNTNGVVGFAAADNDGEIVPMLMLPITDIWNLEVPGFPNVGDSIRPFLVKKGEGQYVINSPLGNYIATQKKDYLIVVPENYADQVPADAPKLFAGLGKYVLGVKLDLEKVDFDTIEGQIFGPLVLMASMQDPNVGEQLENVVDIYRQLFKEVSTIMGGIAINPQTADIEYGGTIVPRKGSDWEKMLASAKIQPTMFGGFRGTPENSIVSFGYSMEGDGTAASKMNSPEMLDVAFKQYEALLTGFIEQIEGDEGTAEDVAAKAKKVIDSVKKIIASETKRGGGDTAFSLDTAGTLLLACDTASLDELRNLATMIKDYIAEKAPEDALSFIQNNIKKEYTTIEGFKVSSFNFPLAALAEQNEKLAPFEDITLGGFYAVKDMEGKQAIAGAVGLDFAKTEQAFKSALEKTKQTVPVQQPVMTIYTQGIGKFTQQTLYPILAKTDEPAAGLEICKQVASILASAGNDAKVTLDYDLKPNQMGVAYRISGKSVEAVVKAIKAFAEITQKNVNREAVQDF